jgi:hypothetical protein
MHWLDLYYIVIPPVYGHAAAHAAPLHVSDVALLFGIGGTFAFAILWGLGRQRLMPTRDPWLHESLSFENV